MLSQEVISHLLSQNNPPQTTTTIKPIYSKNQNELSLVKSTADGVEEKVERKLMVPMYSIKSQRNQCELYPIYFYRLPLSFPFFISKFIIGPNLISGEETTQSTYCGSQESQGLLLASCLLHPRKSVWAGNCFFSWSDCFWTGPRIDHSTWKIAV